MLLFLLIQLFNVDQGKLDWAMETMGSYYNQPIVSQDAHIEHRICSGSGFLYLKDMEIEFSRGDIIVGDEPAETLNISGYFYNDGDIIVINDGVLNIRNADSIL